MFLKHAREYVHRIFVSSEPSVAVAERLCYNIFLFTRNLMQFIWAPYQDGSVWCVCVSPVGGALA